jgi:hypothetical protein
MKLEWEYKGAGTWTAKSSRSYFYEIDIESDGLFHECGGVHHSLTDAQATCQAREDVRPGDVEPKRPAVNITGPCMGRRRDGEVVEIDANHPDSCWFDKGFVWRDKQTQLTYKTDGCLFLNGDQCGLDIVETWPLPESTPVEPPIKRGEILSRDLEPIIVQLETDIEQTIADLIKRVQRLEAWQTHRDGGEL